MCSLRGGFAYLEARPCTNTGHSDYVCEYWWGVVMRVFVSNAVLVPACVHGHGTSSVLTSDDELGLMESDDFTFCT